MQTNINFTIEELLYIEKVMDIQTSYQNKFLVKLSESFMLSITTDNENLKKLIGNAINEEFEAQMIAKSIRTKIENLRK